MDGAAEVQEERMTEELKKHKAKQLRYKKPIVKDLNLWAIHEDLDEISEACDEVRYVWETDEETLVNALDGDEDEAYEFKMAFADLCAECEQMREDLANEYVPECFDILFVAAGAGDYCGGYLGWDTYEGDYFGIDLPNDWIKSEGVKKMERMTKRELLESVGSCLRVLYSYIGIRYRYDSLKAAIDILKDKNTGILKVAKRIDEFYGMCEKEQFYEWAKPMREFKEMLEALPQEAWIQ